MGHKSFVPGCKLDQLLHYTLRGAWGVWESLRMGPGPSGVLSRLVWTSHAQVGESCFFSLPFRAALNVSEIALDTHACWAAACGRSGRLTPLLLPFLETGIGMCSGNTEAILCILTLTPHLNTPPRTPGQQRRREMEEFAQTLTLEGNGLGPRSLRYRDFKARILKDHPPACLPLSSPT